MHFTGSHLVKEFLYSYFLSLEEVLNPVLFGWLLFV